MKTDFVTLPREVVEKALAACERRQPFLWLMPEDLNHLRAALEQPQDHLEQHLDMVPAGWKLVPVVPTRDMLTTWIKAPVVSNATAPGLYRSMLDTAPQPPVVGQPVAGFPVTVPLTQEQIDVANSLVKQVEPVYQMQRADGSWVDQDERAFNYNTSHGWPTRILYTHPQPNREPLPTQVEQEPTAWSETVRLAEVALHEMPRPHTDWMVAAKAVCESIVKSETNPQPPRQPLTAEAIQELADEGVFHANIFEIVRRIEEEHGIFKLRAHGIGGEA